MATEGTMTRGIIRASLIVVVRAHWKQLNPGRVIANPFAPGFAAGVRPRGRRDSTSGFGRRQRRLFAATQTCWFEIDSDLPIDTVVAIALSLEEPS
jgi:hypothetical protein